jgi:rubrerythrin
MLKKNTHSAMQVKKAFLAESASFVRYLYFADIAYSENENKIGDFFTEVAYRKKELAFQHIDLLKTVGDPSGSRQLPATDMPFDTLDEILTTVISSEIDEYHYMYPTVSRKLTDDNVSELVDQFDNLSKEAYDLAYKFETLLKEYQTAHKDEVDDRINQKLDSARSE